MSELAARIAANVAAVRDRIDRACRRAGRSTDEVQLIAVTKYAKLEWVQTLVEAGVTTLGESRPQQLVERASQLSGSLQWHLVGHLQRNKVRAILPHVRLIHSVDSLRLARRIDDVAGDLSLQPAVLLEVNVSGEASKDGFPPEQLLSEWRDLVRLINLTTAGLMTMAPESAEPEAARPTFQALRQLRDRLQAQPPERFPLPQLSMGMSGDFEVAIEEGATLVRIGSALFDGLD